MKAVKALVLAIMALGLASCLPARLPDAGGVYTLRYGSPYSPAHPFSRADLVWIKYVERASGGRLHIVPYWGGALTGPDAVIELKHGMADIALITPIYMRAGMRAQKVQAGFYAGARTIEEQVRIYRCLAAEFPILNQELAGVHVLAVQGGNLPNILTRDRPVRTLEDMRGLRLRAPNEIVPVLRRLGVDAVTMPMGEVYSAMSKGVIDGVVAPADTLKALHFTEVGRYQNMLWVSRGAYPARAISDQTWNRLPPDLRKILDDAAPIWEAAMAAEVKKGEAAGFAAGRAAGTRFQDPDPGQQARFDAAYSSVALESARGLTAYGVDGEAMFRRAQALIARGGTGCPAT